MAGVLLSKKNGAKLEGDVELRGKNYVEIFGNELGCCWKWDKWDWKDDADEEALSLRRQQGRNIENKRETGLNRGRTSPRGSGECRNSVEHSRTEAGRLVPPCWECTKVVVWVLLLFKKICGSDIDSERREESQCGRPEEKKNIVKIYLSRWVKKEIDERSRDSVIGRFLAFWVNPRGQNYFHQNSNNAICFFTLILLWVYSRSFQDYKTYGNTTDLMPKQTWEASCLLLSQALQRFAKFKMKLLSSIFWFCKVILNDINK